MREPWLLGGCCDLVRHVAPTDPRYERRLCLRPLRTVMSPATLYASVCQKPLMSAYALMRTYAQCCRSARLQHVGAPCSASAPSQVSQEPTITFFTGSVTEMSRAACGRAGLSGTAGAETGSALALAESGLLLAGSARAGSWCTDSDSGSGSSSPCEPEGRCPSISPYENSLSSLREAVLVSGRRLQKQQLHGRAWQAAGVHQRWSHCVPVREQLALGCRLGSCLGEHCPRPASDNYSSPEHCCSTNALRTAYVGCESQSAERISHMSLDARSGSAAPQFSGTCCRRPRQCSAKLSKALRPRCVQPALACLRVSLGGLCDRAEHRPSQSYQRGLWCTLISPAR